MPTRYLEDFTAGDEWVLAPWSLSEREIVDFAKIYDPQAMHTDPSTAAAGPHGGVIASGWQTALGCVTPFLVAVMQDTAALASPGFETFKWLKPVRPGDRITPVIRLIETRRSQSKPDRGLARFRFQGVDEGGAPVWEAEGVFFISCRDAA